MICAAIVVRMADTLESILALMEAGLAVDGLTLIRALYEATVKFMWLAIDPEANLSAWLKDADAAARKHHDETLDYGMELLTPEQRAAVQNANSLPPLTELAAAVDKHWEGAMLGFHEPETGEQKLLTMRGLYTMIYRTTSLTTHLQPDSLEPYIVDHTGYTCRPTRPTGGAVSLLDRRCLPLLTRAHRLQRPAQLAEQRSRPCHQRRHVRRVVVTRLLSSSPSPTGSAFLVQQGFEFPRGLTDTAGKTHESDLLAFPREPRAVEVRSGPIAVVRRVGQRSERDIVA